MSSIDETLAGIADAPTWDQRIAAIRRIPGDFGTNEQAAIYAAVARRIYVPHLSPDFAYISAAAFYERPHFEEAYAAASSATQGFSRTTEDDLAAAIAEHPETLLVFRTITGFTKSEFAQASKLVGEGAGLPPLTGAKVDSMEREGSRTTPEQARLAAMTLARVIDGSLFGDPPGGLRSKQAKPDTENGWESVRRFAADGVPFSLFLHQRHYGGAFRQVLDATSTLRGDMLEDAVETLFRSNGIHFLRTGSNNQGEIARRFQVEVAPAPDFVVHDDSGALRAMLECKIVNDGGTARDKAARFARLREEARRLGGVPLLAVLSGMGWTRVNDALGPVVRDTDGRVFTLATLEQMLEAAPFPSLRKGSSARP